LVGLTMTDALRKHVKKPPRSGLKDHDNPKIKLPEHEEEQPGHGDRESISHKHGKGGKKKKAPKVLQSKAKVREKTGRAGVCLAKKKNTKATIQKKHNQRQTSDSPTPRREKKRGPQNGRGSNVTKDREKKRLGPPYWSLQGGKTASGDKSEKGKKCNPNFIKKHR